jgi:hypothetical protein
VSKSGTTESRAFAAILMGGLAFALLSVLLVRVDFSVGASLFILASLGAGLLAFWVARRANSARSAWGGGCLANGLLSMGVALGLRVQDDLWADRSSYMEDLDRAMGPLTPFVWALAARLGLIALILATVLFALSYWLLGPPHRKA